MAVKGSVAKTLITTAILQVFPGAFVDSDGKTIRIPTTAEGNLIEIKCALTAAKDIIGGQASSIAASNPAQPQNKEMTEQEIQEVRDLISRLNL